MPPHWPTGEERDFRLPWEADTTGQTAPRSALAYSGRTYS